LQNLIFYSELLFFLVLQFFRDEISLICVFDQREQDLPFRFFGSGILPFCVFAREGKSWILFFIGSFDSHIYYIWRLIFAGQITQNAIGTHI